MYVTGACIFIYSTLPFILLLCTSIFYCARASKLSGPGEAQGVAAPRAGPGCVHPELGGHIIIFLPHEPIEELQEGHMGYIYTRKLIRPSSSTSPASASSRAARSICPRAGTQGLVYHPMRRSQGLVCHPMRR